jgi:hypothetical protein
MKDLTQGSIARNIVQMAVPIAAGKFARVRETFAPAMMIGGGIMVLLTLFCRLSSAAAVHAFTKDPTALAGIEPAAGAVASFRTSPGRRLVIQMLPHQAWDRSTALR